VQTARENAALNHVEDNLEVLEADPRQLTETRFDVVAANLTAEAIIELAAALLLIVSGILSLLARDVEKALREINLTILYRREAGEWSALVSRKP
jgi:ribosomal protein L11 methylase PrmA